MAYSDIVGTPFKYGGRTTAGIDCYGVVLEFYKRKGIELTDPEKHREIALSGNKADDSVLADYTVTWQEITNGSYQEGDVLVVESGMCKAGVHCGVYLQGDRFLHATEKYGVIISPLRHYKEKITKAYRWQAS